jgi:hypothetical protein
MDPVFVGEAVLKAIATNAMYVIPHPEYRGHVEERHAALLAAFGEAMGTEPRLLPVPGSNPGSVPVQRIPVLPCRISLADDNLVEGFRKSGGSAKSGLRLHAGIRPGYVPDCLHA